MIDDVLRFAVLIGASDVHLTKGECVCFRIDGRICRVYEVEGGGDVAGWDERLKGGLGDEVMEVIVRELRKNCSRELNDFAYELDENKRFRVNIFKQRGSYAVAIRVLSPMVLTIEELFRGFPEVVKQIKGFTSLNHGIVLVTGPTGSGKSTTLAAMIDEINRTYYKHIITLEDPIEYVHLHNRCLVNQREIGRDVKSFSEGLRDALREDPDVILVGEMRDLETVKIALQAAKTGHLVLSTLHTNNTSETVERILGMFSGDESALYRLDFAETLQGVVSQQLVRRKGGGRVAAVEILVASPAVRSYIREGKSHQIASSIQTGREDGMVLMEKSLSELIRIGG